MDRIVLILKYDGQQHHLHIVMCIVYEQNEVLEYIYMQFTIYEIIEMLLFSNDYYYYYCYSCCCFHSFTN